MDDTQVLDCTQALPDDFDDDIEEGPTIIVSKTFFFYL